MEFLGTIRTMVADELEAIVKQALAPIAPYLRKLGLGLGVLMISITAFCLGLLFFSGAIFWGFSHMAALSLAAVWTGLIFVGIAIIFLIFALLLLHRPR
jgi:hypothetical protein